MANLTGLKTEDFDSISINNQNIPAITQNTDTIEFGLYGRLEAGDAMEVNPSNENTSDNSVTIYEIAQ